LGVLPFPNTSNSIFLISMHQSLNLASIAKFNKSKIFLFRKCFSLSTH
jgi:hypothetical protein